MEANWCDMLFVGLRQEFGTDPVFVCTGIQYGLLRDAAWKFHSGYEFTEADTRLCFQCGSGCSLRLSPN